MAGYSGYRKYREQQRALGNEDETMASTSKGDRKRPGPPVTRSHAKRIAESNPDLDIDEGAMQNAMEAGFMSHGEGSGMMSGSGSDPIPMALPQHQRSVDKFVVKAAGTTFVGPGIDGTNVNNWYQFPWEVIQPFLNDWTTQELTQKWMMWKAENIKLQIKNPLCIQEIGSATNALTTAGQNLHTNLYGYLDNMYIRGTANPFKAMVQTDINNLVTSWKHHGFAAGTPIKLPLASLSDTPALFQNNWPDVKQCGMGPGKSMEFSWNINSKYWRPTDIFNVVPTKEAGGFGAGNFARWDERLGRISRIMGSFDTANDTNREQFAVLKDCNSVSTNQLSRTQWTNVYMAGPGITVPTINGEVLGWDFMYIDPDPIPGVYLQLQPQLGAISTGISDSIAQVQWEIEIDIVCTGRLPRMVMDSNDLGAQRTTQNVRNGINSVHNRTVPLFYDISLVGADS